MTRWFFIFCICMVLGATLMYFMQQDTGYVLIVWGHTSIEMSLWFSLLLTLVVIAAIFLTWCIVRGTWRGAFSAKDKLFNYSEHRAQQETTKGLIHFIEEDWLLAHKKLLRSANKVSSPIINYLAAARCAYETGSEQKALELLHKAEKSAENSDLAVALTQARMQLANKKYEQALATLQRIADVHPQHKVVLTLQQQVYSALKDWESLRELLPKLQRHNIGSDQQRDDLELTLHQASLEALQKQGSDYQTIAQYWSKIPERFQFDEQLLKDYAHILITIKRVKEAQALLVNMLKHHWRSSWVRLYGLLKSPEPEKALTSAQTWLKQHQQDPTLLLTLGRLCLQNQQWGRAKDYLNQSVKLAPSSETYAELARLYAYLGEHQKSQQTYQQGLLASVDQLVATDIIPEKASAPA